MYSRTITGQRVLALTAVVTLLTGVGLLMLRQAVGRGADDQKALLARLQQEKQMAQRYALLADEQMEPSANPSEARSRDQLIAALNNNGLAAQGGTAEGSIAYDNPEVLPDGREKLRVNIQCNGAPLDGLLRFLREIESSRRNLTLLSYDMAREKADQDSWNAHFVYGAVILRQAKSRN